MTGRRLTAIRARTLLWALGSTLCLVYYAVRCVAPPIRTAFGLEHRLMPITSVRRRNFNGHESIWTRLHEEPEGKRWAMDGRELSPSAITWPRELDSPRRLGLWHPYGAWELRGTALHRLSQDELIGWLDPGTLAVHRDGEDGLRLLEVDTGRVLRPSPEEASRLVFDPRELAISRPPAFVSRLGLEQGGWLTVVARRRRVYFRGSATEPLLVARNLPAPALIWLTHRADPLALSRDGRTLFFIRDRYLWRLDLRRPLPELLDESPFRPPAPPRPPS